MTDDLFPSPKSRLSTQMFAFFLGVFGAHRFYVGKVQSGLLMLFTFGGLGKRFVATTGKVPKRRTRPAPRRRERAAGARRFRRAPARRSRTGRTPHPVTSVDAPSRGVVRQLLTLALPIIAVNLGMTLMGAVDTLMVGRLSAQALASVALGNVYFFSIAMLGLGITLALDPVISQAIGADDPEAVACYDLAGHPGSLPDAFQLASSLAASGNGPVLVVVADHVVAYVAGTVLGWPWQVIARLSPTTHTSTPAASAHFAEV